MNPAAAWPKTDLWPFTRVRPQPGSPQKGPGSGKWLFICSMASKGWVLGNSPREEILAGVVKHDSTFLLDHLSHELGLWDCYWCPQSWNLCSLLVSLFLSTVPIPPYEEQFFHELGIPSPFSAHFSGITAVGYMARVTKVRGNILRNVLFFYE